MGYEAEENVIKESMQLCHQQAGSGFVPKKMENVGFERLRQRTKKTGLDGLYYRRMYRENEVVHWWLTDYFALEELKLAA